MTIDTKPLSERLRASFAYDADTGLVTRRVAVAQFPVGSSVGSTSSQGYLAARFEGRSYLLHRLIWVMVTGEWPIVGIDHINHKRTDNRWSNLRLATNAQNSRNRLLQPNNSSGVKGVFFNRTRNLWEAQIGVNWKKVHLGRFKTIEEATAAYRAAAKKYFGDFSYIPAPLEIDRAADAAAVSSRKSTVKISRHEANIIRAEFRAGTATQVALAKKYGLARRTVWEICNGLAWKEAHHG